MSDHAQGFDGDWPVDEHDLAHGIGERVKDDHTPPPRSPFEEPQNHVSVHVPEGHTVKVLSPAQTVELENIIRDQMARGNFGAAAWLEDNILQRRLAEGGG